MKLHRIKAQMDERLRKSFSPKVILDRLRFITEDARLSAAYSDPLYIPFYYHLGRTFPATTLVEIGFRLGLSSSAFLRGCQTVRRFLAFQEHTDEYYSPRLGRSNVKDCYKKAMDIHVGTITDDEFIQKMGLEKWSAIISNEEVGYDKHMAYFDTIWRFLDFDGLLVVDYINRHTPTNQAFFDFCKAKGRTPITFSTRYGVGIIQK